LDCGGVSFDLTGQSFANPNLMEALKRVKLILVVIFCTQFALAESPAPASLTFVNTNSVYLRDNKLANPIVIPANSQITLDPQFVLSTFRTSAPSHEQVQRLFMNPGEFYGRVGTDSFIDANDHRKKHDYFFPVSVQTPDGSQSSGKMALYTYNRVGLVELQNGPLSAPPRPTEGSAAGCVSCTAAAQPNPAGGLSDVAHSISQNSSNPLWEKYKAFAKEFTETNKNIPKSQAGYYKRLYIWSLIQKFGVHDAGSILEAITGFAESPYRTDHNAQIAEIAGILKVVENRSANSYRMHSRTLRDIGYDEDADSRLTNVLADWQFSCWNEKDNSLLRILRFNPDDSDAGAISKMAAAFDTQLMMNTGKVQFLGDMNDSDLQHYHASYVAPKWAKASKRVKPAIIRVDGVNVDLGRQHSPTHIFYAGVP
jgi:hypothetical protein